MADAAAMARANEPVPDMVKQFVVYFYRHIREKNGTSELRDDREDDATTLAPMRARRSPVATIPQRPSGFGSVSTVASVALPPALV